MIRLSLTLFLGLFVFGLQAQEVWSLEKCIKHAMDNSLSVKQADLSVRRAELADKGNKNARLPNVSASTSVALQSGRTVNPNTNTIENAAIFSNSHGLSASVLLYNGSQIKNSIKQSEFDFMAAQADRNSTINDLSLQIAGAYLNVLFAEERLENANKRLELTKAQLEQTDKLINAGSLPRNDRLDILAQIAQDEQAIITQENQVELSLLNLKQLLLLEPDFDLQIERPTITSTTTVNTDAFGLVDIYQKALQTQPQIKAGELRMKSAEIGIDIAKAGYYPTVSLFGSLRSSYISNAKTRKLVGPEVPIIDANYTVDIDGIPTVLTPYSQIAFEENKIGYFSQMNDQFGQSVGLNVNIPIYNNGRTKIAEEQAELNIVNTQVANEQIKQQLKASIQNAIADAKAAQKQLAANEKTVEALTAAYANMEKRFKLGSVNTFELTTAKNRLDQAEVDLIVAKYNYLYTVKIVEFYEGKELRLD